jgi:hypothetical protein
MPRVIRSGRVHVQAGLDYAMWRARMLRVTRGVPAKVARRLARHSVYLNTHRAPPRTCSVRALCRAGPKARTSTRLSTLPHTGRTRRRRANRIPLPHTGPPGRTDPKPPTAAARGKEVPATGPRAAPRKYPLSKSPDLFSRFF